MKQPNAKEKIRFLLKQSLGTTHFKAWWWNQVAFLFPEKLVKLFITHKGIVRLQLNAPNLSVTRFEDDQNKTVQKEALPLSKIKASKDKPLTILDQFDPHETQIEICLPQNHVLITELSFPLAVEENLTEVIQFEIDRYTPFTLEQVYFSHRIIDKQEEQIVVELTLTPRKKLHELLNLFKNWQVIPDRIYAVPKNHDYSRLPNNSQHNLIPDELRIKKQKPWGQLNFIMTIVTIVLFCILLISPIIQKSLDITELNTLIKNAKKEANETSKIQNTLDRMVNEANFLVNKKQQTPLFIKTITEISSLLPTDSWIHMMEQNGVEVRIQGKSPSPSSLIGQMEASDLFENAKFRSPVTRDAKTGLERFHLSVDLITKNRDSK